MTSRSATSSARISSTCSPYSDWPGVIRPEPLDPIVLTRDYPVMVGMTLAMFFMAYGFRRPGRLNRFEGALLVLAYGAYQTLLYFAET